MAAYLVVLGNNRSPDWVSDYVSAVPDIFPRYGGEYLGVGKRIKQFEGPEMNGNMAAIFSFPSLEKIEAFMSCDAYRPFAEARKSNMDAIVFAFDSEG